MKNALMVPAVFIAHVLLWSVCVAFLSVLSSDAAIPLFVSGNYLPFIIESLWFVLKYLPLILALSFLNVFFYLMRHKSTLFISIPLVLALAASVVLFAIPGSYGALLRVNNAHADVGRLDTLSRGRLFSPGVIRPDAVASRMIWFSSSSTGDSVSPLVTVSGAASGNVLSVYPQAWFFRDTANLVVDGRTVVARASGEDPLRVRGSPPQFFASVPTRAGIVVDAFFAAYAKRPFDYAVLVGAFFAAVCALWFVCHLTGWRLLNVVMALAFFICFVAGFPYTASGFAFETVRRFLPASFPPGLISPLAYLSFAALVSLAGIVVWIRRAWRRSRGSGVSYE